MMLLVFARCSFSCLPPFRDNGLAFAQERWWAPRTLLNSQVRLYHCLFESPSLPVLSFICIHYPKPLQGKNTLRDDCHAPFGTQVWRIIPFDRAYHELVCVHLLLFDLSNTHGDIAQLLEKRDLPFGTSKVYTPPPASAHIGYETILMFVCG